MDPIYFCLEFIKTVSCEFWLNYVTLLSTRNFFFLSAGLCSDLLKCMNSVHPVCQAFLSCYVIGYSFLIA